MLSEKLIQDLLRDRNLFLVAQATGLQYQTVWKFARGRIKRPTHAVVLKLANYLEAEAKTIIEAK